MGEVYCFMNEKGGVGKSTVTMSIAHELAKQKKVLIIDFDCQKTSVSNYIGVDKRTVTKTIQTILEEGHDYKEAIIKVNDNLDIIPSNGEVGYMGHNNDGSIIGQSKNVITAIAENYDYVLVDVPPSGPIIQQIGLAGVNKLVMVMSAEYSSIDALEGVQETVQFMNEAVSNIDIVGVVINRVGQKSENTDVVKYIEEHADELDIRNFKNILKESAYLGGAVSIGHASIVDIEPYSVTACGIRGLVQEIFQLKSESFDPYTMIDKEAVVVVDHIKRKGRSGKASKIFAGKRFVVFEKMGEETYYSKPKWIQKEFMQNGESFSFGAKITSYFGITKDGTPYIIYAGSQENGGAF